MTIVTEKLISYSDEKNADFLSKLTPTVDRKRVLGVRTPILRKLAKNLYGTTEAEDFLGSTPHYYLEENTLHLFLLGLEKNFEKAITKVDEFLPFVDNWATCDGFSSLAFKKNTDRLSPYIDKWISSKKTYTVRFGVGMLLRYYLDENFSEEVLSKVSKISSDEYYVNMMIAWFFATALAKKWDYAVKYIRENRLSDFCHNKTIQKARESFRITEEQKSFLKTLKR